MRYDFRKVQKAIAESGKTYKEVEELTGIDYTTVSRAIRTGRAHQSTALALTKAFRVPMRDIQISEQTPKTKERKTA